MTESHRRFIKREIIQIPAIIKQKISYSKYSPALTYMQTYSRIFPRGIPGGDQVNSISVSERTCAATFSGFSGKDPANVGGRVDWLLLFRVGAGGVVAGVVTGRGSPARENGLKQDKKRQKI